MIGTSSNWMYGGAGRDTLIGGGAVDLIQGDTFSGGFTQGVGDTIGPVFDYDVQKGKYTFYIQRTLGGQTTYYARLGQLDINGSDDVIYSGAEHDLVDGELGNDQITLGEGADTGVGREGNDTLSGEGGADLLFGDFNHDASAVNASLPDKLKLTYAGLEGQFHGRDLLSGGDGNDTIYGNGGSDTVYGGDGADLIWGDDKITPWSYHGADEIDGGLGNDQIVGDAGNDTLRGGEGNDLLFGDEIDDAPNGTPEGVDQLFGEGGADTLSGGGGRTCWTVAPTMTSSTAMPGMTR